MKKATTRKQNQQTIAPRSGIRFKPDAGTMAKVHLGPGTFAPKLMGLIANESFRGCGLVMMMSADLAVGAKCRVQVGEGPILSAEVRWRADLDSEVMRIGLLYLE